MRRVFFDLETLGNFVHRRMGRTRVRVPDLLVSLLSLLVC